MITANAVLIKMGVITDPETVKAAVEECILKAAGEGKREAVYAFDPKTPKWQKDDLYMLLPRLGYEVKGFGVNVYKEISIKW